jgi:hypothetical protein
MREEWPLLIRGLTKLERFGEGTIKPTSDGVALCGYGASGMKFDADTGESK